jgi:putative redox protein
MDIQGILTLVTVDTGLRFASRFGPHLHVLDSGDGAQGPSPMMALLEALAACEAMDVISILRKKRQQVLGYTVTMRGTRAADPPRRFLAVELVHRLEGRGLSEAAVLEAIRLSEEKYCSVRHTLRPDLVVTHRHELVEV